MAKNSNPWSVSQLEEFLYFCCPECEGKYHSKETFVLHAFEKHPKAKDYLELRLDSETVTVVCKNQPEQGTSFKLQEAVIEDVVIVNNVVVGNDFNNDDNFDQETLDNNDDNTFDEQENSVYQASNQTVNVLPKYDTTKHFLIKPKNFETALTSTSEKEASLAQITCSKTFYSPKGIRKHVKVVHEGIKDFNCDQCEKAFSKRIDLERHLSTTHNNTEEEIDYDLFDNPFVDKRKPNDDVQTYKCDLCNKIFNNSSKLSKHIIIMHEQSEEYQCEYCDKKFSIKGTLTRHVLTEHNESVSKPYPCKLCNESFLSSSRLLFHTRKYHDQNIKCEYCAKTFGKLSDKKSHISNIHEGQSNHKENECNECGKLFSRSHELTKHIRQVHLGVGLHNCDYCDKSYRIPKSLSDHIRKFHRQQRDPVFCNICNKQFSNLNNVQRHIQCVHQGIRPILNCEHCGKRYESYQGLDHHIKRVHEGQKVVNQNAKCHWCGKVFTTKHNMRKHVEDIHLTPATPPTSKKLKTVINPF